MHGLTPQEVKLLLLAIETILQFINNLCCDMQVSNKMIPKMYL